MLNGVVLLTSIVPPSSPNREAFVRTRLDLSFDGSIPRYASSPTPIDGLAAMMPFLFLLAGAGTAPLNFAILVEFCLVNDEKNMLFGG